MHNTVIDFLVGSDYATNQQEVTRQNRLAIRYFAAVGVPVALINYAAQSITRGALSLSWQRLWLLCYFVALLVAERYLIPQNCKRATWLVYIVQAPAMIISILLGTVWDPSTQALTFLMFMIVMPVFILDRPIRVMGVTLFWNLVFLTLCLAFKDPATHIGLTSCTTSSSICSHLPSPTPCCAYASRSSPTSTEPAIAWSTTDSPTPTTASASKTA